MDTKIVFLDIDGVLNSQDWYVERKDKYEMDDINNQYPFYEFSPAHVANLNKITEKTGAKIVVSSTWRNGRSVEELSEILKSVGVTGEVIDKTPHLGGKDGYTIPRGCEISKWLKARDFKRINWSVKKLEEYQKKTDIRNYVILDDDSDMLYGQREHFVQTSWMHGLNEEVADEAIRVLESSLESLYYPSNVYCPACGACGEDGCCTGAMCKKLACHYGESYRRDYLFNEAISNVAHNLMEEIKEGKHETIHIPEIFDQRWHEAWDKIYKNEE
jgi:hypothetical protein